MPRDSWQQTTLHSYERQCFKVTKDGSGVVGEPTTLQRRS